MQRFNDTKQIHDHILDSRGDDRSLLARATIYTDGAANPNPGPGGYGLILNVPGCDLIEHYGGASGTTNNRMEMTAVLQAMRALPQGITGVIHSDSQYVIKGITVWMHAWEKNGWRRKSHDGEAPGPILNLDLWQEIWRARYRRSFEFKWIRGHNGHKWNERADELAEMGRLAHIAGEVTAIDTPPAVIPKAPALIEKLAI